MVGEQECRLDVDDFGSFGEGGQREVAQVLGVAHGDVDEEVVGPGDVEDLYDLGQTECVRLKRLDNGARVHPDANRYHGLYPDADRCRVDVGVVAAQYAVLLKATDAL